MPNDKKLTSGSGSRRRSRLAAIQLFAIALFAGLLSQAEAAAAPRNFLMALWESSDRAYTDLAWFWLSETPEQPSRIAILRLDGYYQDQAGLTRLLSNPALDWSKIAAVWIDEPYLNAVGDVPDPCGSPDSTAKMHATSASVAHAAKTVAELSPSTRFWVNFSKPELEWMKAQRCVIRNEAYIDVIGIDYYQPFNKVKPYYDWLKANPATPYQQRALVPLVASKQAPHAIAPSTAARWLRRYFDYAAAENRTCNLPIGRTGVTNLGDRCSVWLVSGWPAVDYTVDTYVGFFDPSSAPIRKAWQARHRIVISDRVGSALNGRVE